MRLVIPLPLLLLLLCASQAQAQLRYHVALDAPARRMQVAVCSESALAGGSLLGAGRNRQVFVRDVVGDGDSSPQLRGRRIDFGPLRAGECLRYAVDAHAAAKADRYGLGWRADQYLLLPLDDWLWRPWRLSEDSRLQLDLPAGWSASLPWPRRTEDGSYRLLPTPTGWGGTSAFGRFVEHPVALPGGQLRLTVLPAAGPVFEARVRRWVVGNAQAMLTAYGRLPLADVQVLVVPLPGVSTPVPWAQVNRGGGSALKLFVGADASEQALRDDWTLAHEMAHLLHPYLQQGGRWLSEGLASYYQNVLRARVGALSPEQAWSKLDAGFARGRNDRRSHGQALSDVAANGYRSTMRIYWSGAAFWLEAELALRRRGEGDLARLLDRFRARHLPAYERWPPERLVAELDAQLDSPLFAPLYRRYAAGTAFPSLVEVYAQLGLGADVGRFALREHAPAAAIREAIMRQPDSLQATDDGRQPEAAEVGTHSPH